MGGTTMIGLAVALASGVAIGIQVTLNGIAGRMLGAPRAGLLINLASGVFAGLVILAVLLVRGTGGWQISRTAVLVAGISGPLGVLIVTGIAFSLQRTGVAAGIAALFLGQMLIGVIVDALGQPGIAAIPLDLKRLTGLLLMSGAVVLLLPRA